MRGLPFIVLIAVLPACGADKPEPRSPASATSGEQAALSPEQDQAVARAERETGASGIHVDDEILRLCPNIAPTKFSYNSSQVRNQFRTTLVELSKCMKEGGLKDKKVLLVGRADPRGEDDYNLALGGRRASAVQDALRSLGVDKSRLDLTSRGELDAKGTDEKSWAEDRRVDIRLATR